MAKTTTKKTTSKKTARRKLTSAKSSPGTTQTSSNSATLSKSAASRVRKNATKRKPAGETEVTVDRRREDRRTSAAPSLVECRKIERRAKVTRRRQIDPTTCERDYSDDEVEFMSALDDYKRSSGRMFPTCSEVLEVIRGLGYAKVPARQSCSIETAAPSAEGGVALVDVSELTELQQGSVYRQPLEAEAVRI